MNNKDILIIIEYQIAKAQNEILEVIDLIDRLKIEESRARLRLIEAHDKLSQALIRVRLEIK